MTRRTRTFLLDNTLGKIFTNVQSITDAGADKLIAGTKLLVKRVSAGAKVQAIPTINLGGGMGILLSPNAALLTQVELRLTTTTAGQSLIIELRKGVSLADSVGLGTFELDIGVRSAVYAVAHQIQPSEYLYVNIIQSGSVRRGAGLSVQLSYYAG